MIARPGPFSLTVVQCNGSRLTPAYVRAEFCHKLADLQLATQTIEFLQDAALLWPQWIHRDPSSDEPPHSNRQVPTTSGDNRDPAIGGTKNSANGSGFFRGGRYRDMRLRSGPGA